jgi:serine/threonine protein phosphatase PrpC
MQAVPGPATPLLSRPLRSRPRAPVRLRGPWCRLSVSQPDCRAGRLAEIQGTSDTGTVRRHNEDRFLIDAALGVAAVADGMGGHQAGAVASTTALAVMHELLAQAPAGADSADNADNHADPDRTTVDRRWQAVRTLAHAVGQANAALYAQNRTRGHADGQGMGTTLTGWQWLPDAAAVASFHVGDTRLYRYRDGVLAQLTRDQTAYQLALEQGGAGALPPQNVLLQALGPLASVAPDIVLHDVRAGDVLLLCSDGLHGWVPHAMLQETVAGAPTAAGALGTLCADLVALATAYGSRDNVTAVAARFAT